MMPERIWAWRPSYGITAWARATRSNEFSNAKKYIRADTLEAELRRCRAETLREAATAMRKHAIDRRTALMHREFVAQSLECMANEAEREAGDD